MLPDVTDLDWPRLAEYVRTRRTEIGLPQRALGATTTIVDIEKGLPANYRPMTFRRIEEALGWTRGSCDAILRGGEPTLARGDNPVSTLADALGVSPEDTEDFIDAIKKLSRILGDR